MSVSAKSNIRATRKAALNTGSKPQVSPVTIIVGPAGGSSPVPTGKPKAAKKKVCHAKARTPSASVSSPVLKPAKAAAKKAPAKAVKQLPTKPANPKAGSKKAAPAKKAPAAPKAKGGTYADMQANRAVESKVENPVRAMWDLCDSMVENRRKDVIAAAVAKGIAYYTARTQYQLWLTAYRNSK